MALTFVQGKPKKAVKVDNPPASLEEAMTPIKQDEYLEGIAAKSDAAVQSIAIAEAKPVEAHPTTLTSSKVVTEEANSEVLTMVDRYTEIQALLDAHDMTPLIKEQEKIKTELAKIAKSDQFPANKKVQLHGTHKNYVEFSEQANSTKIVDKPGLIDAITVEKYLELTDITLANAKKVLSESELDKYTTQVPGARTLKSVHKGE